MRYQLFEVPIVDIGALERPAVTALHCQEDGSLLCGLSFCRPLLFRLRPSADGTRMDAMEDLKIEENFGSDAIAILGGLRSNTSSDTAFTLLHSGFLPTFLRGMGGGDPLKKEGSELEVFLHKEDGGMGAIARHSVVQISAGALAVRRLREPGVLLDCAHIGDFLFGLTGSAIWREPYLNTEKREVLRKDIFGTSALHRDDRGTFWFLGRNGRLLRMGQTDLKPKPTPLKLLHPSFTLSSASSTDGWLYGTTADSRELFRIRMNPESHEEEMQKVATLDKRITGLLCLDRETNPLLVVALEGESEVEFRALDLIRPEDPELLPPAPPLRHLFQLPGLRCLGALSADIRVPGRIWAGESRLGCGIKGFHKTRVVQISDV